MGRLLNAINYQKTTVNSFRLILRIHWLFLFSGIHLKQYKNHAVQNESKEHHCEEEVQQLMDK